MFTFLTAEHKQKVHGIYKTHLLVVFLWGILVLMSLLVLLLVPSFLIARAKHKVAETDFARVSQATGSGSPQEVEQIVSRAQERIAVSHQYLSVPYLTETLLGVVKYKTPEIKINSLSLERSSGIINIAGVAQDRTALLDFVKKLKGDTQFEVVDFPISSLVKSQKVDFSLILHIKTL
jgi:Tfp pilus assembly protein PilN